GGGQVPRGQCREIGCRGLQREIHGEELLVLPRGDHGGQHLVRRRLGRTISAGHPPGRLHGERGADGRDVVIGGGELDAAVHAAVLWHADQALVAVGGLLAGEHVLGPAGTDPWPTTLR